MAEAKGKRLLIAAELDEGMRLNTSIIKQLCSTDAVFAEKKYKDPFQFIPSHTLVLYTNHRENNDWLGHFLDECCELGEAYQEKSGDFYTAYRNFCNVTGDYVRNSADFYTAIEQAGIMRFRNRQGRFVSGIRLTEKAILN